MAGPWDVLEERPIRPNADGSVSTELSITVTNPRLNGGRPTNIPSMWGGRELDEEGSVTEALKSQRPFPAFNSIDEAVAHAKARSATMGRNAFGGGGGGWDVVDEKPADPGLWQRAKIMARDAFEQSGTGTVIRRNQSGQAALDNASLMDEALGAMSRGERVDPRNPYARTPMPALQRARDEALRTGGAQQAEWMPKERARRAEVEALPSWSDDPSLLGKVAKGATNIGAMLVGGAPSPENLIPVGRGATLARTFLKGAAVNAAANVPVDVAAQMQDTQLGLQDGYDPVRTAVGSALAAGVGGAVNAVPHAVASARARRAARPLEGEVLPPAPAPQPPALPSPERITSPGQMLTGERPALPRVAESVPDQVVPADFVVAPDGTATPRPQVNEAFQPGMEATPEVIARRAEILGMGQQDAPAPRPSVGEILAAARVAPDRPIGEVIDTLTGVSRPPSPKVSATRAADVRAALNEDVGVAHHYPEQTERPLSAAEYYARSIGQDVSSNAAPPRPAVQESAPSTNRGQPPRVDVTEGQMPEFTRRVEQKPVASKVSEGVESRAAADAGVRPTQLAARSAEPIVNGATAPAEPPRLPLQNAKPMPGSFVTGEVRANATPSVAGRHFSERPLAADGLKSYRYRGRYGYVMIGAEDDAHALREAARSTDNVTADKLEAWNGERYTPVAEGTHNANAPHQEISRPAKPGDRGDAQPQRGAGEARGGDESVAGGREANVNEGGGDGRGRETANAQISAAEDNARGGGEGREEGASTAPKEEAQGGVDGQPQSHDRVDGREAEAQVRSDGGAEPRAADVGDVHGRGADSNAHARAADSGHVKDSGTLYANPIGKVLGWGFGDAKAWGDTLKGLADQVRKLRTKPSPDAGNAVKENWLRAILDSSSADVRAKVAQSKSDTARWVVDQFHQEAGSGRAVGETFENSMHAWVNQGLVKLDKVINGLSAADLKQAVDQVAAGNPRTPAARAMKTALDDALAYMRANGVEVGEVKGGYFPRQFDTRMVAARPKQEFVDAVSLEYQRQGMAKADADAAGGALYNTIVFGEQSSVYSGGSGAGPAPFLKGRVFGKDVDNPANPLHRFLERDPLIALPRYLMAAAKRAEIAKRFGDGFSRWGDLTSKITKEGGGQVLDSLRDYVGMAAGLQGSGMSPRAQRASSWMRTWGSLMFLEKATLSSLTEFITPAIRSGNPLDVARSLKNTLADLVWHAQGAAERRAFAEDLGLLSGHLSDGIMAARWAGGDPVSNLESRLMHNYFRRIGLSQWTDATQVAAANIGQVFVRRLALDFASGGKLVRRQLADLGVPDGEQAAFAAFVRGANGGMPNASHLTGPLGDTYARAVRTFVRQSIMAPSSTHRPAYMNSPIGKVIGQLQSFNYAFWENVWKRSGRMAAEAATGAGYTAMERAQLMAPMMTIPMLWAAAYAIGEGRDALLGDPNRRKEETGTQKALKAMGRGAPIAPLDPIINYAASARYRTDALKFIAGPVAGTAAGGADAMRDALLNNSDKTNTAERKAAKAAYDLLLEPTVNFALGFTPVSPVSAALTQTAGSGQLREKFVSSVAGPQTEKGGKSTGRETGRPVGRPASR